VAWRNRVVYGRRGLAEWYANGPLGLEQGFTLTSPPRGPRAGPLTLEVGQLPGGVGARVVGGGHGVLLVRAGHGLVRYGGLFATDSRGRALPARVELSGGRLLLRVDERGARYPLRIDPVIQQGGKLIASDEHGSGLFGLSVALSSDGNTALIGGEGDNGFVGAAWVFVRSGGSGPSRPS
jgi:hypothetical protein